MKYVLLNILGGLFVFIIELAPLVGVIYCFVKITEYSGFGAFMMGLLGLVLSFGFLFFMFVSGMLMDITEPIESENEVEE